VSTLILDREADIYSLPRAVHFDGECMRVFQTIGIADELAPHLLVVPGMRFVDAAGRVLIEWARPTARGADGWYASYRFHQPALERTLRKRLAAQRCIDIALRHDVFSLDPAGDHTALRMEDLSTGRLIGTRARYVVGCDGARSTVRRFMGTELDDMKSHERWLVVDVVLKHERKDLGDFAVQYCDPARPATYVRGIGMRRRWELMMQPGEDAAAMMQPEKIWELLSRWLTPDEAVLEFRGGPRLAARCAHDCRRCRASDPAVHGPGHVRGNPRRRQPGLETCGCAQRQCARRTARYL
jgi:3-(3-hydroxy-phenyl)propionate hydroxylase